MKCLIICDKTLAKQTTLYASFKRIFPKYHWHVYKMIEPISMLSKLDDNLKPLFVNNAQLEADLQSKFKGISKVYIATENTPIGEMIANDIKKVVDKRSGVEFFRLRLCNITKSAVQKALTKDLGINKLLVRAYMFEVVVFHILNSKIKEHLTKYHLKPNLSFIEAVVLQAACSSEARIRLHEEKSIFRIFLHLENGMILKTSGSSTLKEAKEEKTKLLEAIKNDPVIQSHTYIESPPPPLTLIDIIDFWKPKLSVSEKISHLYSLFHKGLITNPISGPNHIPTKYRGKIRKHPIWKTCQLNAEEYVQNYTSINPIIVPIAMNFIPDVNLGTIDLDLFQFIYKRTFATQGTNAEFKEYCISYDGALEIMKQCRMPGYLQIMNYREKRFSKRLGIKEIKYPVEYVTIRRPIETDLFHSFVDRDYTGVEDIIKAINQLKINEHIFVSPTTQCLYPTYSSEFIIKLLSDSFPFLFNNLLKVIYSHTQNIIKGKNKIDIGFIKKLLDVKPERPTWLTGSWKCPSCDMQTRIGIEQGRAIFKCSNNHISGVYIGIDNIEPKNTFQKWRFCPECKKYRNINVRVLSPSGVKKVECPTCNYTFEY